MVDALRHKVNGLGYSKPDVALEYISDNSFELYKSRASVVAGSHATHTAKSFTEGKTEAIGEAITIQGWKNVVAYEVKDADGKLILFAVVKPLHLLHIRLFCLSAGKKGLNCMLCRQQEIVRK